jgi:hypothetical protein
MGQVVRFSEFDNVIITLNYEPKRFHTRTFDFIKNKIQKEGISLYTTVNTTQEYLEFYRRLLMTEGLRTAIHPTSGIDLPNRKKQAIKAQSSILHNREAHQGAEPVFSDRELKKIREVFFQSGSAGIKLWKALCEIYLKKQLAMEFQALDKLNISYLSVYKDDQKDIFQQKITWEEAISICSDIAVGFSDSMIINALQCTTFPFAISLDSDFACAVTANPHLKDVVMPDELVDNL